MACFLVPGTEAIVVTAAYLILKKHEQKIAAPKLAGTTQPEQENKRPFSARLKLLAGLLWGGVLLLAFEHVWHGEVVPWPPFLTAMSDPAATSEMLHEMATVGVTMAITVTAVWGIICIISEIKYRRTPKAERSAA